MSLAYDRRLPDYLRAQQFAIEALAKAAGLDFFPLLFEVPRYDQMNEVAAYGAFNLGFVRTPAIFASLPMGWAFAFLWFFLLFLAGVTSSVALSQPAMSFFEDNLNWSRRRAAYTITAFYLVATSFVIFVRGTLNELDFWAGTFGLVLFGAFEAVIFVWIFGSERSWEELHVGALERVPRPVFYIMKYVTPTILLIIIVVWGVQNLLPILTNTHVGVWLARAIIVLSAAALAVMVRTAWRASR